MNKNKNKNTKGKKDEKDFWIKIKRIFHKVFQFGDHCNMGCSACSECPYKHKNDKYTFDIKKNKT